MSCIKCINELGYSNNKPFTANRQKKRRSEFLLAGSGKLPVHFLV